MANPISLPTTTTKPHSAQKTPQKPNSSILKTTQSQQQLTPGKSVKFKLASSTSETIVQTAKQPEFLEPFEIVNLKEKMQEIHKSSSTGSLDSVMSTISSRSAINLPARLADFENDEKLMNEDKAAAAVESYDYQMFSNESSNTSLNSNEQEKEEEALKLPIEKEVLFKQPVEVALNKNEFSKINSLESFANSTVSSRTGTGLAERLNDFETETIEENFQPMERVDQGISHVNSLASVKSTISSQSAKNLQERLQDFENESISDYKISGNDFSEFPKFLEFSAKFLLPIFFLQQLIRKILIKILLRSLMTIQKIFQVKNK